jgi:hypothetical protein
MLKSVSSVANAIGALNYVGTWNASTNSPTLANGVGTKGDYYVVSVAGSTDLDGETLWGVGDWAVFNGAAWQKLDGGSTANLTGLSLNGVPVTATAPELNYMDGIYDASYLQGEIPCTLPAWTSAVTGTGTASAEGVGHYLNTNLTAGSTVVQSITTALSRGVGQSSFRYSFDCEFQFLVSSISSGTANGKVWLMQTATSAAAADPTAQAIGFRVDNLALKGLHCDSGGTLTITDLGVSLSAGVATHLRVNRTATGIFWYVDGVQQGFSNTSLPSGDATGRMVFSVTNGIDAARQWMGLYRLSFRTKQS